MYPPDNRELDYTNSGMVKVISESFNGDALSGSAFVIGDHLIATAAHCVVSNSNSNRCKYISDLLLFDSNGNISLNATPVEVHVEKNYFVQDNTSNDTDIFANDYAVIVVEEDLSSYTHLQLTTTTNNFYNSYENIYLTGFPHEITDNSNNSSITVNNSTSLHNEYTSVTNHIINMDSKYLYYRNDNSAGNSGGPVYLKENYNDMEYYSVVAINVSDTTGINLGDEIFPMNANEGVRITTKLLRFYYNNDNLSFWY